MYWVARGKVEWEAEPGTDVWAVRNKRISITPLHMELTSDVTSPFLKEIAPNLFDSFKTP